MEPLRNSIPEGHLNFHPKGDKKVDTQLFFQFLISGIVMGTLYWLMSLGVNFIYGIIKVINWAMGEFLMVGAYVQYLLRIHSLTLIERFLEELPSFYRTRLLLSWRKNAASS